MFVTVNHIPAPGPAGRALEARFAARQRLVDQLPGFQAFELLRPHVADAGPYLVMTTWASRADFDAWRNSPEQRPVRPAHGGHLAAADERSWPTLHETAAAVYEPEWPRRLGKAEAPVLGILVIEVVSGHEASFEQAMRSNVLGPRPGCLTMELLRSVDGGWDGPDASAAPNQYLVCSRWLSAEALEADGPLVLPSGLVSRTCQQVYDILQPSYAAR